MTAKRQRTYTIIECADCGGPAKAANKLTRYCSACRLARGAQWHDGRSARCACGRDYIAWNGRRTQRQCGECFAASAAGGQRESITGTCAVCKRDTVLHSDAIRICFPCLDRPERFDALKAYIVGKYRRLQSAASAATLTSAATTPPEQEKP